MRLRTYDESEARGGRRETDDRGGCVAPGGRWTSPRPTEPGGGRRGVGAATGARARGGRPSGGARRRRRGDRRHRDLLLVAEAADGADTLARIRELDPDVALVELELTLLGALDVLAAVAAEGLRTRVLVISERADGAAVRAAVAAGAAGYLTKREPLRAISGAIRTVAHGRRHLSSDAQTALLDALEDDTRRRPVLTDRELEILRLTAEGTGSAEIARRLFLSESTVKSHQQRTYRKLGVAKAAAAVYEATRRGLL